jgi:long-subunit fatty acid transport protein
VFDYTDEFEAFWRGYNASIEGAINAAVLGLPRGTDREFGHVNLDMTWPQVFRTGFRMRLSPSFTLSTEATWTDWSVWEAWTFKFDRNIEALKAAMLLSDLVTERSVKLELKLDDTWHYGLGLTQHLNSRLDIYYGLELRKSPISHHNMGPIPIGDMKRWGIGFGYKWDKQTKVTASMFYMQSIDYLPSDTSCHLNCTNLTNIVGNPYAGLDVKFSVRVYGIGIVFSRTF